MKTIYASEHGRSKKVAQQFDNFHNAKEMPMLDEDIILFICPTYGDEELHPAMENFLISITEKKSYVICELGNYYGYDDFSFGAKKIIESHLKQLGWSEFFPSLSLDSMPSIDWKTFNIWKDKLENALQNCR
jgi:flavodoxin